MRRCGTSTTRRTRTRPKCGRTTRNRLKPMTKRAANTAPPEPPAPPPIPAGTHGPLRVVLFGLPRAGKTALLAALAQVQHEHPAQLNGDLADASGALNEQRRHFYEEIPRSTDAET